MKNKVYIKPGREKSIQQRHPWVFSGAIEKIEGTPEIGETVQFISSNGEFLGWGAYSPSSSIRARIWSWNKEDEIEAGFFRKRIEKALKLRLDLIPHNETNAVRLIHGESDGLPGLVVDRYGERLVVQILSAGPEYWQKTIVKQLVEVTGIEDIYERSDVDVRQLEGLSSRTGVLHGSIPDPEVKIFEHGINFWADLEKGQKTGFYIDQRTNRKIVGEMAAGRDVLNCFCYTGGFSLYALKNGANSVLSIDSSADALEIGRHHVPQNGLPEEKADWMEGDVFKVLRTFRDQGKTFDMIILDPPKFAPTAAQAERAARGYKDINLLAFKMLRPGGVLASFSCSGGISADLFQKIVAGAALDAKVDAKIVRTLTQGPDHPVALNFPEGAYLKGLIVQVS